jgi:hypothetical protein
MKKNLLGIFIMVEIVLSACAGQKNSTSQPDVSYMKMYRTSCFGTCPSYSIELYKNGLVRYTGIRFIPDSGVYEKNIGTAKAQELLNMANTQRIDTLKNNYELAIADLPGINYTFKYGTTTKQVSNAHFGPTFLREIARDLDAEVINYTNNNEPPKLDGTWKRVTTVAK